jgi:hypothetical protein
VRDAKICSGRRYNDKTDNLENGSHVKVTAHITGSTEQCAKEMLCLVNSLLIFIYKYLQRLSGNILNL